VRSGERIERAVGSLPARLRAAEALALIEERPYQEIAGALDVSVSAVKMRVARAVRLLRTSLEKMGIRPSATTTRNLTIFANN
jgi:DNA-directed RNA polymerase specialized sigma24 family protein